MPPPSTLRQRCARSISAPLPTSTEPTGAPSPFEKQIDTESNGAHSSAIARPDATAALHTRAPSRCAASPRLRASATASST